MQQTIHLLLLGIRLMELHVQLMELSFHLTELSVHFLLLSIHLMELSFRLTYPTVYLMELSIHLLEFPIQLLKFAVGSDRSPIPTNLKLFLLSLPLNRAANRKSTTPLLYYIHSSWRRNSNMWKQKISFFR